MIFSSLILRTWSRSPLTRLAADRSWLACAFLLLPPALRVAFSTDTSSSPAAIRQAKIANFSLKEQRRCCKCRAVFAARAALHADDGHSECVSCLGKLYAEPALTEMEFSHCVNMSIASLCARIAFFSESNSVPSRPPVFFLPGTCEEKTAGQRDFALCCERAHAGSDPACLALAMQRWLSRPLWTPGPVYLGWCKRHGLIWCHRGWAARWHPDPAAFIELRSATDLALRATKATAQAIGRSVASLVVLERHLWLNLTEIKEADKVPFFDSSVSPVGLFGPAVEGFVERFTAGQKSSQAMQHFLPKRSSSANATSRPKPAQTQQPANPTPSPAQPTQKPEPRQRSRSARRYPFPKRQGPRPKLTLDPAPQASSWSTGQEEEGTKSRHRRTTPKWTLLCSQAPRSVPGAGGSVL